MTAAICVAIAIHHEIAAVALLLRNDSNYLSFAVLCVLCAFALNEPLRASSVLP